MRIQYSVLLLSLLAAGGYAQTSPALSADASPPIVVLEKKWQFQIRNPALDESPYLEMEERAQYESDVRANQAENRRRAGLGMKPVKMSEERPRVERKEGKIDGIYTYEIKVQNAGQKAIRAMILEYVFLTPNTETEVGRLRFLSSQQISPGKIRHLTFRLASPPTGAVNAGDAKKKLRELYSERVVVHSIEYKDGSAWSRAPAKQ